MFGLTKLMHTVDPETTLDKFLFLIRNAFTKSNPLTTTISFSALFSLVALRELKNRFKGTWWIYRIPEVLVVVLVSTCVFSHSLWRLANWFKYIQFSVLSFGGTTMASIYWAVSIFILENRSFNSHSTVTIWNFSIVRLPLLCKPIDTSFVPCFLRPAPIIGWLRLLAFWTVS